MRRNLASANCDDCGRAGPCHVAQVRIMRELTRRGPVIAGLDMQEALTVEDRTARGVGQCLRLAGASSAQTDCLRTK